MSRATRPVSDRRAATRRRLLDAAVDAFAAKGFGATTVEDVCARAGFTRGAFYSNFDSLTEVFLALHAERADALVARLQAVAAGVGPVTPATLPEVVARVLAAWDDDPRWTVVLAEFTAHALRDPVAAAALDAPREALARALRPLLGPGAGPRAAGDLARVLVAVHDGLTVQAALDPSARLGALRRRALQAVGAAALSGALTPDADR